MEEVNHSGLHWVEGGIAFLEQEKVDRRTGGRAGSGSNATGEPIKSPFVVRLAKRGRWCNHFFIPLSAPTPDPQQWGPFLVLARTDPLVRVMLPVPRERGSAPITS